MEQTLNLVGDQAPWIVFVLGAALTFFAVRRHYRRALMPAGAGAVVDKALVEEALIGQWTELLAVVLPFIIVFAYSCFTTGAEHVLQADELSLAAAVLCSQAVIRIHHLAWKAPAVGTNLALVRSTARLMILIALCIVAISPIAAARHNNMNSELLEYIRIVLFLIASYLFMTWGGKAILAAMAVEVHTNRTTGR